MTDKYRVVVGIDDFPHESPEEYALFKVVSFGRRHGNYEDPDAVIACRYEDEDGWPCDEMPNHEIHNEDHDDYHKFVPDPDNVFMLSYFEHGLCRWGLTGTMNGMPDFQWDGVYAAGMLKWDPSGGDPDGSERKWWDELSDEKRREIAEGFLEEYTDWCNGSIYYIDAQKWIPDVCGTCGQAAEGEGYWDSLDATLGGIIGYDNIKAAIEDYFPDVTDYELVEKY